MTYRDLSLIEGLDPSAVEAALSVLRDESDRGSILVAIAILDSAFERRLEQLLSHGNSEAKQRLLNRSFNTFAAKVDLAFCIGLIPPMIYHDIRRLNQLRNRCAHGWADFRITEDVVREFIEPMSIKRALDAANEVDGTLFPSGCAPRRVFISTLAALVTLANLWQPFGDGESYKHVHKAKE